jgi:hypothetical protein
MTIEYFFDIEADGLYAEWEKDTATRIDCCCALRVDKEISEEDFIDDWQGWFSPSETNHVIGHNIIDYDLPMLAKHEGWSYSLLPDRLNDQPVKFLDTLLLSKLLNPDRQLPDGFSEQWEPSYPGDKMPGPHSLEVWGFELGIVKPKLVYGDKLGRVPVEVSIAQCKADIEITQALYRRLTDDAKAQGVSLHKPVVIENAVRHIISEGAREGVVFDQELARDCIIELDGLLADLAGKVEPQLPPRQLPQSKLKMPPKQDKRFNKDGTPSANNKKYFGDALQDVGGVWTIVTDNRSVPLIDWSPDEPFGRTDEPMMMSNQADIKDWLVGTHGWKPTLWNTKKGDDGRKVKTSPKFHEQGKLCTNLEGLGEVVPIINNIVLWLSYRNRRNVIQSEKGTGWLNHPRLQIDGKLPSDADTIGTATFRHTHRVVANVTRKTSVYGEKMRDLFTAPEGMVLVGWDAAQLEDRCKAHYCYTMPGGREYINKILDPDFDVHTENAVNWGIPREGKCKNGHYALQYNCQPPKLAETLAIDLQTAQDYWDDWWDRNAPLRELSGKVDIISAKYNGEFLPAIDGRLVPTRYKHSRVNALLQSAGAIAMKYAMVWWWIQIRDKGIPAKQVIHYHDEAVAACSPDVAEEVGELGVQSIKKAGEMLNFRVPLLSDYHVGKTWKDIH